MILIISPAKTQDFTPHNLTAHTTPALLDQTSVLVESLRKLEIEQLGKLLRTSLKLSTSTWQSFHDFQLPFDLKNAKQALLAFKGEVYRGIQTNNYSEEDFIFANKHLRILSGLYGILKPLDLIQPYRLEMATPIETTRGKGLYAFWNDLLTEEVNTSLMTFPNPILVNLASQEYFKALRPNKIKGKIVTIAFKERKDGAYRTIAIHAKKARGKMVDFVIKNRLNEVKDLLLFSENDYSYNKEMSTSDIVFCRG